MEKLNIAELLRDCPTGMELDCTICDNVYFDEVTPHMIKCFIKNDVYNTIYFHHDGAYLTTQNAKCVIFPKGKTTWEGFQRPFKEGDILYIDCNDDGDTDKQYQYIFILKEIIESKIYSYCFVTETNESKFEICYLADQPYQPRFATEKEKQKLFDAIKANGYKWNDETKTLEKLPKFKVGDWVEFKYYERKPEKVIRIENNVYWLSSGATFMFQDESAWDLTTNKFDITTLKPFESKVLVRQSDTDYWKPAFWGKRITNKNFPFITSFGSTAQAIPFKGNEWLVGTTNDCDNYFKTWE